MKRVLIQQATRGMDGNKIIAFPPQSVSGSSAINGQIIDRLNYREAIAILAWAAVSGSPSAGTFAVILQHGNAANLSDAATLFTLETALDVKTAAGSSEYHMNLENANCGRYVRLVITPTYTSGTSPANLTSADLVLGGSSQEPVPATGANAPAVFGS